jgi:hypothetical protein
VQQDQLEQRVTLDQQEPLVTQAQQVQPDQQELMESLKFLQQHQFHQHKEWSGITLQMAKPIFGTMTAIRNNGLNSEIMQ